MRVLCKHFKATFKSWDRLFMQAADFATTVGPDRLISVSHSHYHSEGIVTVWYWGEAATCHHCDYDLTMNRSGTCPECGALVSYDAPPVNDTQS